MHNPAGDMELSVAECLQRSRDRKKRRIDMRDQITSKNCIEYTLQCIANPLYGDIAKCLLKKMLSVRMVDDRTSPVVIECISALADELFRAAYQCKDGNGFDLIRLCLSSENFPPVSDALRANYSSLNEAEDKCIFWTLCGAFLIIYFELHSDSVFETPLTYDESEFELFLRRYPEFLIRTWDASSLLEFQLCMKRAVQCFGNGNNMGCLVELVTFVMKGRDVALTCNTSGGGLRNYDHPTEVSTEKCRILIYQRESGILPRTRKSRGSKRRYQYTGPVSAMMPVVPGINAPRNGVVPAGMYMAPLAPNQKDTYFGGPTQTPYIQQISSGMPPQLRDMYTQGVNLYQYPMGIFDGVDFNRMLNPDVEQPRGRPPPPDIYQAFGYGTVNNSGYGTPMYGQGQQIDYYAQSQDLFFGPPQSAMYGCRPGPPVYAHAHAPDPIYSQQTDTLLGHGPYFGHQSSPVYGQNQSSMFGGNVDLHNEHQAYQNTRNMRSPNNFLMPGIMPAQQTEATYGHNIDPMYHPECEKRAETIYRAQNMGLPLHPDLYTRSSPEVTDPMQGITGLTDVQQNTLPSGSTMGYRR